MLAERIAYDHKGVTIYMDLDYEKGEVSMVEKNGQPKKYNFSHRTRNYLGGWWLILEALKEATIFADKKLEEQENIRAKIKEKEIIDLAVYLHDLGDKK